MARIHSVTGMISLKRGIPNDEQLDVQTNVFKKGGRRGRLQYFMLSGGVANCRQDNAAGWADLHKIG
jgi:hypothetical protein